MSGFYLDGVDFSVAVNGEFVPGSGGEAGSGIFALRAFDQRHSYAWYAFEEPQTEVYLRARVLVPSATVALITPPWSGDLLGIYTDDNDRIGEQWEGMSLNEDNDVWAWLDYWQPDRLPFQADTWQVIEVAVRPLSGGGPGDWEANIRADGAEGTWTYFNNGFTSWEGVNVGSMYSDDTLDPNYFWYIDDVKVAFDTWVSDGGTVVFSDGFASGDFSAWSGSEGLVDVPVAP